ncbi:MAG: zinc ribbon domain-containing protein [Methanobrevibacter sp.]|uniref:zinc ribbon domain-containing protein n=1 Tax=Methanobrevibacter sp. TaxID=66852 RepID=UPI0025FA682E|nr:zinc ribbon domain-containing protein [Methanobrevibacter sp.]MBR0271843.1 zinc ribbon domain-containing protein [Methanobrevibacter sp.]
MVFCSKCGKESSSNSIYCNECGHVLMDDEYLNLNKLETFNEIANESNLKILENNQLSTLEYNVILKNIENMAREYLNDLEHEFKSRSTLGKIKLLTLSYADVSYKSKGAELGSYSYNRIQVDDRLNDSDVISTLIHELSHHLFDEIFEQILMYVWEIEKSDALEAYVSFTLGTNAVFILMNEYCAHSVEGRFIPHGYQNYGSFNKILTEEFDLKKDSEAIFFALILGNSIADDIIHILENFIDDNLRREIRQVYKDDYSAPPSYDQILLEKKEILDDETKVSQMHMMLMSGIALAKNKESAEVFSTIKDGFISNNS